MLGIHCPDGGYGVESELPVRTAVCMIRTPILHIRGFSWVWTTISDGNEIVVGAV